MTEPLLHRRVVVCGSRDWPAFDDDQILHRMDGLERDTLVITGGAPGADHWAAFWADRSGLKVHTIKADWKKHGKAAGPIRNRQMLDMRPDLVIAFQKGKSRGTQHTIDEARRRGIAVEIHSWEVQHAS